MWRAIRTWFVDQRISVKINILLVLFTLTFIGVAVGGAGDMRTFVAQQERRHQALAAALSHMQAAQQAESEQRLAVQYFVVAPDAGLDKIVNIARSTDTDQDAALAKLAQTGLSPAQSDKLRAYVAGVAAWRAVRDDALRTARQGGLGDATEQLVDEGVPVDRSLHADGQQLLNRLVDAAAGIGASGLPAPAPSKSLWLSIVVGIVVALGLSALTARTISRPLAGVVDVLERVSRGDLSRRVEVTRKDEIGRMGRALNDTLEVLREAFDEVQHRATHDPLTGLANRTLLGERMAGARQSRRAGDGLAVLLIDLDGFKQVNDTHGHEAGDRLLVTVAERLLAGVRATDTVARIGGDEFVVLLDSADAGDADRIAAKLLADVQAPVQLGAATVLPNASVGVSLWTGGSVDDLMREADHAMYAAKTGGKGRVTRLTPAQA